jgi:carboxyl-terminal processing protease
MKWLRGLASLVLIVVLAGCRGHPASPAPATPAAFSSPQAAAPPQEQIIYAFRLLITYYVESPEPTKLLTAAWEGALEELRPEFQPPTGLRLNLPPDVPSAEQAFRAAFQTLLSLAPATINRLELTYAAINAMANSLNDDHTYYLLPDAYDLYLSNETIGLAFSGVSRSDGLLVWYIYEGGPADRAGLRPGDVIQTIDGKPAGRDRDLDAPNPFKAGVPARLVVDRPGAATFEVTAMPERSQRRILDWRVVGDIGYLRLYRFPPPQLVMPDGQTLPAFLDSALSELRSRGVKGFVVDLRNNPGGSEVVAASVAGRLGLEGALVENRRRGAKPATIDAIGDSRVGGLPAAVLINQNSASSSELVVSALQQQGLAHVFGRTSAGVVNTARSWAVAGGGLFITTEKAYAGRDRKYLDAAGVEPDEPVSLDRAQLASGHDSQLERALEWLRSRVGVASGGR